MYDISLQEKRGGRENRKGDQKGQNLGSRKVLIQVK